MKTYSGDHMLQFSWQQVATAFWQRYPNPYARHVLSEDTIWRKVSGHLIHTVRLLRKTNRLPKWGERFAPSHREIMIVEESILDRKSQTLTTYTRNVDPASRKVITVDEKVSYGPSTSSNESASCSQHPKTSVHRQAWIQSHIFGFKYLLEEFGKGRFKSNVNNANKGFEHILALMYPESVPVELRHSALSEQAQHVKEHIHKAKDAVKKGADSIRHKYAMKADCSCNESDTTNQP